MTLRESVDHSFDDEQDSNLVPNNNSSSSNSGSGRESNKGARAHTMKASDLQHKYLLWGRTYNIEQQGGNSSNSSSSGGGNVHEVTNHNHLHSI